MGRLVRWGWALFFPVFLACGSEADVPATPPEDDGGLPPPSPPPPPPPPTPLPDGSVPDVSSPDVDAATGNVIVDENAQPGTDAWRLTSPATAREIEGYASATSVAAGETLKVFVSTASPSYVVNVYRLGWYGGKGGRLVMGPVERTGTLQPTPAPDPDGLVECDWTDPLDIVVPATWVSGMYVARLETKDTGKQSYVPFVVRDDVRVATYLFQSSVTTFQAYNNWGGHSLYDFNSVGGVRASRVSFLRPYAMGLNPEAAAGVGAGELLTNLQGAAQTGPTGWEYPMVRFLEREGYDVSYVTNVDVHRDPALVAKHPVFLSVGHDEYWSSRMRDHVEHARDHGTTSLAFFSGNVSYWQVRFEPSKGGVPNATLVCHKDASTDPVSATTDAHETTVRFGNPLLSRSEEGLGGVAFQEYGIDAPLVLHEPSSWVFAGTGLTKGQSLPGLLGYEVEGASEPPLPGVLRVMRSPWSTNRGTSGTSDVTVRALPSGAETFAAGSIQLAWGLDDFRLPGVTQPNVAHPAAQAIVRNVLARFAAPRPPRNENPLLFEETFSTPIDPLRWTARTITEGAGAYDPLVPVSVVSGRLVITPRTGVTGLHHGAVATARTYPLTCGAASVELVQATKPASTAGTTFAVAADAGHYYRMTVEAGVLYATVVNGGAPSSTSTPYDATTHRHLRIRHDCVHEQLLFETSANGTTWSTMRATAPSVDLHAGYIELDAGTFQAETAPGQAIFDGARIVLGGVKDDFSRQRDPELFTPGSWHEGGYDPEVRVFHHGGALHLRPRAGVPGQHHMGYVTTRVIDWTGGIARVSILQAPSPDTEASLALAVLAQDGSFARTAVSAGKIFFQLGIGATVTGPSEDFDPSTHAHVRLRHDATTNEIVWETSPDGGAWTEHRRVVAPFALTGMHAEIEAGTYRPEVAPGEAIVDDFVFAK